LKMMRDLGGMHEVHDGSHRSTAKVFKD
jgi:hypothetical protein